MLTTRRSLLALVATSALPVPWAAALPVDEHAALIERTVRLLQTLGLTGHAARTLPPEELCRVILAAHDLVLAAECVEEGLSTSGVFDSPEDMIRSSELAQLAAEALDWEKITLDHQFVDDVVMTADWIRGERCLREMEAEHEARRASTG